MIHHKRSRRVMMTWTITTITSGITNNIFEDVKKLTNMVGGIASASSSSAAGER